MTDADAILVRTNGGAIGEIVREMNAGRVVGVTKGTKQELRQLVETARYLQGKGPAPAVMHDDLAPFRSWQEVVDEALKGDDRKITMLEKMVRENGVDGLDEIVSRLVEPTEDGKRAKLNVPGAAGGPDSGVPGLTLEDLPHGLMAGPTGYDHRVMLARAGWKLMANPDGRRGQRWTATGTPEERQAKLERFHDLMGVSPSSAAGKGEKRPGDPDVIVSTAHKAKGLEWERVRIGDDFFQPKTDKATGETIMPEPEELKLDYVAVTRARGELDPGSLAWVYGYSSPNGGEAASQAAGTDETDDAAAEPTVEVPAGPIVDELRDLGVEAPGPAASPDADEPDGEDTVDVPITLTDTPDVDAPEAPQTPAAAPPADDTGDTPPATPGPAQTSPADPSAAPSPADTAARPERLAEARPLDLDDTEDEPVDEPAPSPNPAARRPVPEPPTGDPEDLELEDEEEGGTPAQWVPQEDLLPGAIARVDGTDADGNPTTESGYVTELGTNETGDANVIGLADTPDGDTVREVEVEPDAPVLRTEPGTIEDPEAAAAAPSKPDRDVLEDKLPPNVPTDVDGEAMYPGSEVDVRGEGTGVVDASNGDLTEVTTGDDHDSHEVPNENVRVTDQDRPAGWTVGGRRVEPGQVVEDRGTGDVGVVDSVDGDTVTVTDGSGTREVSAGDLDVAEEALDGAGADSDQAAPPADDPVTGHVSDALDQLAVQAEQLIEAAAEAAGDERLSDAEIDRIIRELIGEADRLADEAAEAITDTAATTPPVPGPRPGGPRNPGTRIVPTGEQDMLPGFAPDRPPAPVAPTRPTPTRPGAPARRPGPRRAAAGRPQPATPAQTRSALRRFFDKVMQLLRSALARWVPGMGSIRDLVAGAMGKARGLMPDLVTGLAYGAGAPGAVGAVRARAELEAAGVVSGRR